MSVVKIDNNLRETIKVSYAPEELVREGADRQADRKPEKYESGGKEQITVGEKELIAAIEKANRILVGPEVELKFSVHRGTKQIMVKMINEESGEVIREIPPEKMLNMIAKMWELAGIIVDEKV